ncbi:hypothetical protein [Snuella sedimenti]|uniref:Uncharacterized protein n=1 Tax=Snuella sedimenti TaxID=2798802 RepID=A0A8J7LU93_9FLAO|nr:hypothetical protein [Snuella sedimenti]MBJ6369381.1 hypothetical protein [Snuella sedimenti]
MKVFRYIVVMAFVMVLLSGSTLIAQGKSKEIKEKNKKEHKEKKVLKGLEEDNYRIGDRLKSEKKDKASKDKGNKGQGNAYGKHKGELKGRAFGQARAAEAKKKLDDEFAVLEQRERDVRKGKERIEEARKRVDKEKESGVLTEDQEREKRDVIERAEKELNDLEGAIKRGKERIKEEKEKLLKIYNEE